MVRGSRREQSGRGQIFGILLQRVWLGGVGAREWEFKVVGTKNLLIGSWTWELTREGEGELGGPTPIDLFLGGTLVIQ